MIKLTFEFSTSQQVAEFLQGVNYGTALRGVPPVAEAPKSKAKRTTPPATAPVENAAPKEFVAQLHVDKEGHIQAELVKPAPSSHGVVQSSQPNAAPPRVLTPEETTGHVPTIPPPVKAVEKKPNTPVQAVAVTAAEVNEAAVRAALREVINTKSMKAAAEILKQFGATSISQIETGQYEAFMKACKR